MGDIFGVLLTVLLLATNAFFVGAEFALIATASRPSPNRANAARAP